MGVEAHPGWDAVLFDLDGTLIDTSSGIRAALAAALGEVVGDESGIAQANLTLPLDTMIRSAVPSAPPALRRRLSVAFRDQYDARHWKAAQVYPDMLACLRDLDAAGVRSFVITNKRELAARRLLDYFDLASHFEAIVGQPGTGTPLAKSVLAGRCMTAADLTPASTVVVGDSDQDASMAASWGMTFIALTSGAGPLTHAPSGHSRVHVTNLGDAAALILAGRKHS